MQEFIDGIKPIESVSVSRQPDVLKYQRPRTAYIDKSFKQPEYRSHTKSVGTGTRQSWADKSFKERRESPKAREYRMF